jgi:hypothetical protein
MLIVVQARFGLCLAVTSRLIAPCSFSEVALPEPLAGG